MTSDIRRTGPLAPDRAALPPGGDGASRVRSTAVVPLPVVPVPVVPAGGAATESAGGVRIPTPLDGSGVGLLELLATEDSLLARPDTEPVAREVGLERARGALLRQLPTDALASLDTVWEGARRTEEGWYLRGGALLALGLPGEGERVVSAGIETRPTSNALRFLQSIARLALGDVAGAREALQGAQRRLPSDPLLLVQQAVLVARGGDRVRAAALLEQAGRRLPPDHPVMEYGRETVLTVHAARQRNSAVAARATDASHAASDAASDAPADVVHEPPVSTPAPADDVLDVAGAEPGEVTEGAALSGRDSASRDPVTQAVHRLGGRIGHGNVAALTGEARSLLQALSAGGALALAAPPAQLHGARALLVTALAVLSGEDSGASPVFRTLVASVLDALRRGAPDDAARALRRTGGVTREPTMVLLHELVRGALVAVQRGRAEPLRSFPPATGEFADSAHEATVVFDAAASRGDVERAILLPLRLGLRLLDESRETRSALRAAPRSDDEVVSEAGEAAVYAHRSGSPGDAGDPAARARAALAPTLASLPAIVPDLAPLAGAAATAAQSANGRRSSASVGGDAPGGDDDSMAHGRGARLVAMACVLLAAVAATVGQTAIAVAFGVGAAWLAVRRSGAGRRGDGAPPAPPRHGGERAG